MIRFVLNRPIAVTVTLVVIMIIGVILFNKIPVSLLPSVDVPQIIVKINYPNNSTKIIEQNITQKLRANFATLSDLSDIESTTTNHLATIKLTFDFRTRMDLAYIAVNEKIDNLSAEMPSDLPRPQAIRVKTSDIPIVRLQILPKYENDIVDLTNFTKKVLKKRIEQIKGVSIVDINGGRTEYISINVKNQTINALGITNLDIERAINSFNTTIGSLSVKDGQYKYLVKLSSRLETVEQLSRVPIKLKNGTMLNLSDFCEIKWEGLEPQSYHIFNGKEGIVLTAQKQENAKMNDVLPSILNTINVLQKSYPKIQFYVSQDQTFLLTEGISNLTQDLWFGGILCVLVLFIFLGNYTSPILMSFSIPISLVISFVFFYLLNISFNIISLSGLALGIGMLIDNSILVLENITRKYKEGFSIDDSCISGVNEMIIPITSNVLTTVAIYAPLIYLSGLAGALVKDQAIALTISLFVSLLVAFIIIPVSFKAFAQNDASKIKEDTKTYLLLLKCYKSLIYHVFKHKKKYFILAILFMPLGIVLFSFVPISILPKITETESMITIDWGEPISATENAIRIKDLGNNFNSSVTVWESEIGIKQFLLQESNTPQMAEVYYKCETQVQKETIDKSVYLYIKKKFPNANFSIKSAPNAFNQLFNSKSPYMEVKFRPTTNEIEDRVLDKMLLNLNIPFKKNETFIRENNIIMALDYEKMTLYGISKQNLEQHLKIAFGSSVISSLERFGERKNIIYGSEDHTVSEKLNHKIVSNNNISYPLNFFIKYISGEENKYILGDKIGVYKSIYIDKSDISDVEETMNIIINSFRSSGYEVTFSGRYFENKNLMNELFTIFIISIGLLYFILALQFENLIQPILVMLTIPLGISGAMIMLWITGESINVMTGVGFVVVLGLIVDEPSIKVEMINRLRKEYISADTQSQNKVLLNCILQASEICLKPLLMVSLTTSLALIPIFFGGGIGNDLQKSLAYVIIGGLTIGTFFTLWFIPLAYWFITKKN